MNLRNRNRIQLVVVVLVFIAPIAMALLLNLAGWRPQQTRNNGTLIEPPQDVSAIPLTLDAGNKLLWRDPQWQWTLLALPGVSCGPRCQSRLDELYRVRITLNQNADRLRIIYLGPALNPELVKTFAPLGTGKDDTDRFVMLRPHDDDALALALVDPNGLLMLRYDAAYDAAGLRQDLSRLIH